MSIIELTQENYQKEVIESDKPVLIDFFATWCGPCKMLSPVVEELSKEYTDVKFVKVDVDEEEELAMKYGIMSIPALFLLKDGEVVGKTGGMQPIDSLRAFINNYKK